jgi:hypothetical protein
MPNKPDKDGWVTFKIGERLAVDLDTGEMKIVFSWVDWLKFQLSHYLLPSMNRYLFSFEQYQADQEWCDAVWAYWWLPYPIAEFVTRVKLGRWEKKP